ncbi:ABC-2 type transport system permease protein [Sedimentibacter acidaminivorans]|uniref:ABC-2 type transport system permease protein n=1 Tax=Sedimentibacter acidaminivorans TaxID=913099 RepID=A0ABS4GBR6_9FIRM|nr:ABC transporter permease subunit [Sedimentibacter acidaminivorans]MBP1925126.1 ABC-2 type transport system permease protein [Sedimentibacter acidaminivorans]
MQIIKSVFINEIFKISKKKKITAALIFSMLSVIIAAIVEYSLNNFAGIRVTGNSEFSILILTILIYSLLPLFTTFICVDMFAGEFADHTIKFTLTGPASRAKVFLGKILAIATFIICNLIVVMIFSIVASLFLNSNLPNFFKILVSYFMAFLPIFIFALAAVLISNITRGPTSAFMLSIFVFLVFIGLNLVFPQIRSFLFTSFFDWFRLILGNYINYSKILRIFLILLGYGIMFCAAGYYLFEKKDI